MYLEGKTLPICFGHLHHVSSTTFFDRDVRGVHEERDRQQAFVLANAREIIFGKCTARSTIVIMNRNHNHESSFFMISCKIVDRAGKERAQFPATLIVIVRGYFRKLIKGVAAGG